MTHNTLRKFICNKRPPEEEYCNGKLFQRRKKIYCEDCHAQITVKTKDIEFNKLLAKLDDFRF